MGVAPAGALAAGLRHRLGVAGGVVAIDGWSGSGKTEVASWLAPALEAPCVHLDDLVPGWHGLAESVDLLVEWVLAPLAAGRAARWRCWDWAAGGWGEERSLEPAPIVVVEGCGSGAAPARRFLSALVWLDVDAPERERRLRARSDWATYEPWWQVWSDQEAGLRAGDEPAAAATVVVSAGGLRWRS